MLEASCILPVFPEDYLTSHIGSFLYSVQSAFSISGVSTYFVSETSLSHTHTTPRMSPRQYFTFPPWPLHVTWFPWYFPWVADQLLVLALCQRQEVQTPPSTPRPLQQEVGCFSSNEGVSVTLPGNNMGHQVLLEISGHCCYHKSDTGSKVDRQGKIYFCRRMCVYLRPVRPASTHTHWEVHSVFISYASLPLTLMDRFGFTVFAID
jgi:hypothetical protein